VRVAEFLRAEPAALGKPAPAAAAGLAIDQVARFEFRHDALERVCVGVAPERLDRDLLRRLTPIRIKGVEFEHRGQDALRTFTEWFLTGWNTEQFTELDLARLRAGPGPIQGLGGHAIYDGRLGPPRKDTVAAGAFERVLVLDGLSEGISRHEILAPLTFNHLLNAYDTRLSEEFEDRSELMLVGAECARNVAGSKRRRGTDAGEALIDLLDHPLQILMVTRYGF